MSETQPTCDRRTSAYERADECREDENHRAEEEAAPVEVWVLAWSAVRSSRPTNAVERRGRELPPESPFERDRDRRSTGERPGSARSTSVTDGGTEASESGPRSRDPRVGDLGPICREWFLRFVHELERTPTGLMLLHAGAITVVFVVFALSIGVLESMELPNGHQIPVATLFGMTHDWILSLYLLYLATIMTLFLLVNGVRICRRVLAGHDLSPRALDD